MSHKPEPTVSASIGAARFLTLLVAVCLVGSGLALKCNVCRSVGNYQECLRRATATCTVSMVNTTHLFLASSNPTLRNVTLPKGSPQFQCFQVNYTVAAGKTWNYEMGCTFASTRICEGWRKTTKCHTGTAKLPPVTVRPVPKRPAPTPPVTVRPVPMRPAAVPPATSPGLQVVIVPQKTYVVQQTTPPPSVPKSPRLQVVIAPQNTYSQQAAPPPPEARPAVVFVHGKYKSSAGSVYLSTLALTIVGVSVVRKLLFN